MCEKAGVEIFFNQFAEKQDVISENPELVIIATGGLPNTDILKGSELVNNTWDLLGGSIKPAERVLLYDDNAAHPGLAAAEWLADSGVTLEIITPERFFGADIGGLNHVAYAESFDHSGVKITISKRLKAVRQEGSELVAQIGSDFSSRTEERRVEQIFVEHGTLPLDELYFELKTESLNLGEMDYTALIEGKPQQLIKNPTGNFSLFRIGDAVSSRNIHAAIYDAMRLCITL